MTKPSDTFENLPEEKQQRVLDEATMEFAEHGYHGASVNRIVARLSIAKGSLFKYFGSKEGLFEHLFSHAVAQFKQPLKQVREETKGQDLFLRVERALLAGVRFIDGHPLIYRIYLKMLFQENFPLREKFLSQVRLASAKYLRPMVLEAMETGQLRPDLDPDMVVFHLDSVMDRFLQAWAVPDLDGGTGLYRANADTVQTRARAVADILRHGLAATRTHTP